MINLLPPFARRHVSIAYWTRVTALTFFVWTIALAIITLMHVAVYLQLSETMRDMQQSVGHAEELHTFVTEGAAEITTANSIARTLLEESVYESFTTYLFAMEDLSGPNIAITDMQLGRSDEAMTPLRVSAVADTRQDLISFLDNVERHPSFGSVDVPIANLSQSQDIQFSVSVPIIPNDLDDV